MAEWREWSLVEVEGGVFSNVTFLSLWNCPKLKEACLPNNLPSLETLQISSEHLVASLSMCRYPSLVWLSIYALPKMKTFPERRLPSTIHKISIFRCVELVSLSEEGWPSNLKSLEIGFCKMLFAHTNSMKWNLGMLTSLTTLRIQSTGEVVGTFPEEEGQLPTSLTSLVLDDVPNLKSLNGKAFLRITSLQTLCIRNCKQFQCLPEEGLPATLNTLELRCLPNLESINGKAIQHLPSLQELYIDDCQQLQCLPAEGLPASLSHLHIRECPSLKPRCQRGTGEDWPKIQHILSIQIDHEDI